MLKQFFTEDKNLWAEYIENILSDSHGQTMFIRRDLPLFLKGTETIRITSLDGKTENVVVTHKLTEVGLNNLYKFKNDFRGRDD